MKEIKSNIHNIIYFWALILLVVSMPLSPFLLTISEIILILNWVIEGNWKQKAEFLKNRKSILLITIVIVIHIIWLVCTTDFAFAINDIKIKLSILLLPLVFGTSAALSEKKFKIILVWFILAVFVSTLISTAILFGVIQHDYTDVRNISIFISHIRLSLLIIMSIFILFYWFFLSKAAISIQNFAIIVLILWFILFLWWLQSLTGIVALLSVSIFFIFVNFLRNKLLKIKIALMALIVFILLAFSLYVLNVVKNYYNIDKINPTKLVTHTVNNRAYDDTLNWIGYENGHYVAYYNCELEVANEWNKRSKIPYAGLDKKNQTLRSTLIRYMTSKGITKDSVGVLQLSKKDIRNIESGMTNYVFEQKGLYPRLYQSVWEIDQYLKNGTVNAHSITQRIMYLQTAFAIIKENLWFGVGTGDAQLEFNKQYAKNNSQLSEKWRLRSHNQFVAFLVSFGVIGFTIIIFILFYIPTIEKRWRNFYFLMFYLIVFLSFTNEDTLETQAGATFFAFFFAFFLYSQPKQPDNTTNQ